MKPRRLKHSRVSRGVYDTTGERTWQEVRALYCHHTGETISVRRVTQIGQRAMRKIALKLALPEHLLRQEPTMGMTFTEYESEFCNALKKHLRGDDGNIETSADGRIITTHLTPERRDILLKEYRGALWYMAALADELGTSMEDQARQNIAELRGRAERGTIKGTGDDR